MKPVILLLEDDHQLSDTLNQFLSYKGYDVICAYDGVQAEELFYEKHIDLMLLDVKVPYLSGFEFLKKIRSKRSSIPVIFITSLHSVEDVEKGFGLGCDDYIRKPFALKELLVRIESLLKRTFGTYEQKVMLDDDISFDLQKMQLFVKNEKISLKTKELKLLALFLKHPNRLLKYEQIYEALWEYDEQPSSGALRTYIKTLRASIGKERIETVKNTGYRFVK